MKTLFSIILFLFFASAFTFSQQEQLSDKTPMLLSSTLFLVKDITIYSIDGKSRNTYTYDGKANQTVVLSENFVDNQWVISYKTTNTYDANGKNTLIFTQKWESDAWVNASKQSFEYDANGNTLKNYYENWKNNEWYPGYRMTYTYDSQNHITCELIEFGDSDGLLYYFQRQTYSYDYNGNLLQYVLAVRGKGDTLINSLKTSHSYDENGNEILYIRENWRIAVWENSSKISSTYDINKNLLSRIYENWKDGQWIKSQRITYTYDKNNNKITYCEESWYNNYWGCDSTNCTYDSNNKRIFWIKKHLVSNKWVFLSRTFLTYTNDGKELSELLQYFDDSSEDWGDSIKVDIEYNPSGNTLFVIIQDNRDRSKLTNDCKYSYEYDVKENLKLMQYQEWNGSEWVEKNTTLQFQDSTKLTYTFIAYKLEINYEEYTACEDNDRYSFSSSIYPNPVSESAIVKYTITEPGQVTIDVYNALGAKVLNIVNEYKNIGEYQANFQTDAFPVGMYYYIIKIGAYQISQKFIIMR